MQRAKNSCAVMADQAARGDWSARVRLRRQLEHQMVHIVRRVLQDGGRATSLDRHILAEARRLGLGDAWLSDERRERMIRQVAQAVSATVIARIPIAKDEERGLEDTVWQADAPRR